MCGADPGDGAVDPEARDNQSVKKWRGMVGEIAQREEEIGGKTRVIAGMRRIGSRLTMLAQVFVIMSPTLNDITGETCLR